MRRKPESFEIPLKAAIRETFEDGGIRPDAIRFYRILIETSPTKYNRITYVYLAEIDFGKPPACNTGSIDWIMFDRLLDVPAPKKGIGIFTNIY